MSSDNVDRDMQEAFGKPSAFKGAGRITEVPAADLVLTHPEPKKLIAIATFKQYHESVTGFAKYPLLGRNMLYPALKCAGEAGELADKIGKHFRNNHAALVEKFSTMTEESLVARSMGAASMSDELKTAIVKELGDILWYVDAMAHELGEDLMYVASVNVDKLKDRNERGTILSEGDNR